MSKFFRSMSSDSSSDESTSNAEETDEVSHTTNGDLSTALNRLSLPSQGSDTGWHSQLLLHALLEERCMNQVIREQPPDRRRDNAAIRAEATARYQRLCAAIAPHNLISSGFEQERFSAARQRYRDGLDLLSAAQSVPLPLRSLLTDNTSSPDLRKAPEAQQLAELRDGPAHPILESRYLRDFEELGILGRGGFGSVYRVRHRLDGVEYAVKKVPVPASYVARIRINGQQALDELLREIRTLAKLDHPNVVRYYSGWIEWVGVGSLPETKSGNDLLTSTENVEGSESQINGHSLHRIMTQTDDEKSSHGFIFDTSHSQSRNPASATVGTTPFSSESTVPIEFHRPSLALHLQMGLCPMTLSEYLACNTLPSPAAVPPLKHCFHVQPSVGIMLALLDGVEYLHNEKIVHRDLKPANIFLGAHANPYSTRGSVDLFLCDACRAAGQAHPLTLKVRIGDFGLVTALAQSKDHRFSSHPVGTEIYRPLRNVPEASPKLDIYALGIVAFELLWPFDTRKKVIILMFCHFSRANFRTPDMERHDTISRLKAGEFPAEFQRRNGKELMDCIQEMIGPDSNTTVSDLKRRLSAILLNSTWNAV